MAAVISLLCIITLAIFVSRIASTALALTGVSRELASFQARSALTGAGFTTEEAESIVRHPVRRRIASGLMLFGSAGVITAVSSLVLSFVDLERGDAWVRLAILIVGLGLLLALSHSKWFERGLDRLVRRALDRWTDLQVRDYADVLHLTEDYKISELIVDADDWLAGRTLGELNLRHEGVNVLGITCADGGYIGAPGGQTEVHGGDKLLVYGRTEVLDDVDTRQKGLVGDSEHRMSVEREKRRKRREQQQSGRERTPSATS